MLKKHLTPNDNTNPIYNKKDAFSSVFLFLNNHTIHFIEGTHDKTTIIIHIVNSSPYGKIIAILITFIYDENILIIMNFIHI